MPPYRINMSKRLLSFLIFGFLILIPFQSVFSQNLYQHEIGFQNDNDVYLMRLQDQYYTNGIRFYYKKAIDSSKLSESYENKFWAINIGHKIFNAGSGTVYTKSEVDRPLTGYLYMRGEMSWFTKKERVFSLGTEIAVIGGSAFGKDLQTEFHRIFGFYDIKGWEYQLNSSIGMDLRASYSRLLVRNKSNNLDAFIKGDLSLGLNNTKLSVSPNFRWGRINPLYESASLGSRVQSKQKNSVKEFYFFYRPQINWILYDSTIQGGMLIKDKGPVTFDVHPFVFSQSFGVQLATRRIGINFNYVFNTKEVKSEATAHQYGSFSMAYYF